MTWQGGEGENGLVRLSDQARWKRGKVSPGQCHVAAGMRETETAREGIKQHTEGKEKEGGKKKWLKKGLSSRKLLLRQGAFRGWGEGNM